MVKFCWALTLLATFPAGLVLFTAFRSAASAPQEAAAAALACAIVIIPYVFTRAVEGMQKPG